MSDIELRELSFDNQTDITGILEYYRSNPSNSNKYRYELFGYIDRILESRKRALLAAIRAELPDGSYEHEEYRNALDDVAAILTKYEEMK